MGLPIGKLVVATNENDFLARFWKNGRYEKVDSSHDSTQPGNGYPDISYNVINVQGVQTQESLAKAVCIIDQQEELVGLVNHICNH
jgi:threonine synthase